MLHSKKEIRHNYKDQSHGCAASIRCLPKFKMEDSEMPADVTYEAIYGLCSSAGLLTTFLRVTLSARKQGFQKCFARQFTCVQQHLRS